MRGFTITKGKNAYFKLDNIQITTDTLIKCKFTEVEGQNGFIFGKFDNWPQFAIFHPYRASWPENQLRWYVYGDNGQNEGEAYTANTISDIIGTPMAVEMTYNTVKVNEQSATTYNASNYTLDKVGIGFAFNNYYDAGRPVKWEYFQVYEGNTLLYDLVPMEDANGYGVFYDRVNQTYLQVQGGGHADWEETSSISASASKSSLAATGETITITVDCENAWTVTGNTFLTLSSTGDTGSTTITATAPSYTGATARTDVLTFADSVTGDEVELSIKQKKYSSGQPFYLGANEVTEVYLGENAINEAYLGDVLVYSSGPFQGIKLSPKAISFNAVSLSSELKVKSSEAWSMTLPAWISASQTTGDSGETIVTLTATTQTATTTGTVSVTTANYSASADVTYYDVELVNYVYENSGSYIQSHNLDTGIAHTASTMTVQLKYKARGGNSDRMVGYQDGDVGCSSDSNDFRIFGYQNGNFDYKTGRWSTGTINANGQAYDITIGDCFCLDNTNQVYRVQQTATGVVPSPDCHIYVDMSYIKVKEIIIMDGNSVLYDGKAAKRGNDYGLYDTVTGEFLTSSAFTIVGE